MNGLLREYYNSLCRHLQNEHREWQNVERTNKRILMTKGEVRLIAIITVMLCFKQVFNLGPHGEEGKGRAVGNEHQQAVIEC